MSLLTLPAFDAGGAVHVVVESPRGSTVKLKYDPDLEVFSLSRPLPDGLIFPYDWGFIPSTHAPDGDPVDVMVLWDRPSFPGVVLRCRLIGVLPAEQNSKHRQGQRERNDRLFALPIEAPRQEKIGSVDDLDIRARQEIESFFKASVAFEKKELSFGAWGGPAAAYELVNSSRRS